MIVRQIVRAFLLKQHYPALPICKGLKIGDLKVILLKYGFSHWTLLILPCREWQNVSCRVVIIFLKRLFVAGLQQVAPIFKINIRPL